MAEDQNDDNQNTETMRTNVRFTQAEYLKIKKLQLETGKSLPWLLKTALFERGIAAPTLDTESRRKVVREMAYMGNNLNQIAKNINSGILDGMARRFADHMDEFRMVRSFLGLGYGNRKNSV